MTRHNTGFVLDEKRWFTDQRTLHLNRHDDETKKNILRLEQKFGSACFTPLDIPIIRDKEFFNWYFENAIPSVKQNKDVATEYTGGSSFLSIDLFPEKYDSLKSIWSKNIRNNLATLWPNLWEQFYLHLPFENIEGMTIWSSTKDIIPHRDQSVFVDLPLEFRIVMDDNPTDNFWVSEVLPNTVIDKKLNTAVVSTKLDTNTFAWNNLRTQHHTKFYPEHKKITIIFHWANKINWKKYENLLERSLEKYQKNSLTSTRPITDFVEIEN